MMAKIFLAQPIHHNVITNCRRALTETMRDAIDDGHEVFFGELVGESLISRARHILTEQFLKTDYEYLFFMDSDVLHVKRNPEDHLITTLLGHNKDIVGAVYPIKLPPHKPSLRTLEVQKKIEKQTFRGEWELDFIKSKNPLEVQYLSTGCLLLNRRVVKDMMEKHRLPWQPYEHLVGDYLSEDWAFEQRARDFGYRVYADTEIVLGHVGYYTYTLGDYYRLKNKKTT